MKIRLLPLLISAAYFAFAAAAVSPRIVLDTKQLEPGDRMEKWQTLYSGWEPEGDALLRPFAGTRSGRMLNGNVKYGVGVNLPKGIDAKLEFLDAGKKVFRTDEIKGGGERLVRGEFDCGKGLAYVRIVPTKRVDPKGVLSRPFRMTVDWAVDEPFTYLDGGAVPPGWVCDRAVVTNMPHSIYCRIDGKKGFDRTVIEPTLAIAAGGCAGPVAKAGLLADEYAFEFAAFVGNATDFSAAGVRLRDHYKFTPGIWYHFRYEVQEFNARLKLNGREIARDLKVGGFVFKNLGKEELFVDDVKVFALEKPADYPAPPVKPKGGDKYNVGINVCSLWYEGSHYGWQCVDQCNDRKPVLGYYDEGLPETADWEIKYMVEHGIDFQVFCWYSESNDGPIRHPRLEYQLRDGFKNARYSDRMKYCIMWEMSSAGLPHSVDAWKKNYVPYLIEHHFKDPRYLTLDGKLAFAVFGGWLLDEDYGFKTPENVRAAFDYLDAEVKKLGFKGVEFILSHYNDSDYSEKWQKFGFTAQAQYGYGWQAFTFDRNRIGNLNRAKIPGVHAIPTASVGFNASPWNAEASPLIPPAALAKTLRWCRDEFLPKQGVRGTWKENTFWLSNWNEYGEGTYIMPVEAELGFGYLDAIRSVFTDAKPDPAVNVKPTASQRERICNLYPELPPHEPFSLGGIYPHLAMSNGEGECGTGAVVPWAGRLWVITYGPHCPLDSTDKLYEIKPDMSRVVRAESTGGTHANRMIHRETQQMLIGRYVIDSKGNVRVVPAAKMPGRLTGAVRHLADPANKVYVATMEDGLYELDMHTLEVNTVIREDGYNDKAFAEYLKKKGLPWPKGWDSAPVTKAPGYHAKGLAGGFGKLFLSNNGENTEEARRNTFIPAGVLADWSKPGEDWRTIRRCQFTEVTTPDGIYGNEHPDKNPVWALGWDSKSVILVVTTDGVAWKCYRLPKASHCYDGAHGWNTEWPRIRDIGEKDWLLATMHGTFWKFPKDFSPEKPDGIRPISTYLKVIGDFCRWGDRIVFGCDDFAKNEFLGKRKLKADSPKREMSQSNLWFVKPEDLKTFGPPSGEGWVWRNEDVKKGDVSDPFLWPVECYDRKEFSFRNGEGKQVEYELIHAGDWVRVKALEDVKVANAHFVYGPQRPEKLPNLDAETPYIDVIDDNGVTYRFPNVNGDTNVVCREIVTERDLLYVGGVFYELPAENAGGFSVLRPIAIAKEPVETLETMVGLININYKPMIPDALWKNGAAEAYWLWENAKAETRQHGRHGARGASGALGDVQ